MRRQFELIARHDNNTSGCHETRLRPGVSALTGASEDGDGAGPPLTTASRSPGNQPGQSANPAKPEPRVA